MSLEERARRAAQEASSKAAAEQRAAHRKVIEDGLIEARAAIKAWADELGITDFSYVEALTFEDAVDPQYNDRTEGVPGNPPRFTAQLASGGMSFRAVYNLPGGHSGLSGRPGQSKGLYVYLDGAQHYAFPTIEVRTIEDLGRALEQVDAIRRRVKDDQPVDYFFGVAIPVRIEKVILAAVAAVIVIVVLVNIV